MLGLHIELNFANKQFVKYVILTSGVTKNTLSVEAKCVSIVLQQFWSYHKQFQDLIQHFEECFLLEHQARRQLSNLGKTAFGYILLQL